MKSTAEQLKNRGYVSDDDLSPYKNLPERDLVELLQSKDAYNRTIAVKLLAQSNNEQFIPLLKTCIQNKQKYPVIIVSSARKRRLSRKIGR